MVEGDVEDAFEGGDAKSPPPPSRLTNGEATATLALQQLPSCAHGESWSLYESINYTHTSPNTSGRASGRTPATAPDFGSIDGSSLTLTIVIDYDWICV